MSHLEDVNMSYCEHFSRSIKFSLIFLKASVKAFIHCLFPDTYVHSTTDVYDTLSKTL